MSQDILIVGAGICGMCSALALARKGHRVRLYERDIPPPEGGAERAFFDWQRKGAAQFRHPHAFLGLMCNLLQDNYPDLLDDFMTAGARKLTFKDMLAPELLPGYAPEAGDEKLWVLMCRRATMETVLRRYVTRIPEVEIINSSHVVGIITEKTQPGINVKGLSLKNREGQFEEHADIVVDASGRSSRFPRWFDALGTKIDQEMDAAEIVYYSRHYRLMPGVKEPPRTGKERSAGDLGYLKYGVFPGDNGHFAVIVCLPEAERKLRNAVKDGETFDRMCRSIPGVAPWLEQGKMEATTTSFGIGGIQSVWRSYLIDDQPVALNFFAVGDAAIRTNPLYGRGCSIGILHAHLLADLIEEIQDPVARALSFDKRTEKQLRPIFQASLNEDKNGIKRARSVRENRGLERPRSLKQWFGLAFGDALAAALQDQLHVVRGMMRTVNLLEKPGQFLTEPRIRLTIIRYMLRGRRRNAAARIQQGPSREEMLALVADRNCSSD